MGLRKAFKSWFLTEVAEVKETVSDLTDKAESALRQRESDLKASPEEKLDKLQEQISRDEGTFSDARAAARQEVADAQEYGHKSENQGAMNEAMAKAALDEAKAAERLAQIRKEMGTDS